MGSELHGVHVVHGVLPAFEHESDIPKACAAAGGCLVMMHTQSAPVQPGDRLEARGARDNAIGRLPPHADDARLRDTP